MWVGTGVLWGSWCFKALILLVRGVLYSESVSSCVASGLIVGWWFHGVCFWCSGALDCNVGRLLDRRHRAQRRLPPGCEAHAAARGARDPQQPSEGWEEGGRFTPPAGGLDRNCWRFIGLDSKQADCEVIRSC